MEIGHRFSPYLFDEIRDVAFLPLKNYIIPFENPDQKMVGGIHTRTGRKVKNFHFLLNFNDNCGNGLNELSISPFLPLAQPFLQGIQHLKETMIFPENLLPVIFPGNHMIEYTSKMDSRASGRGKKITSNPLKPILNYLTPFSFLIRIPTVNPVALQRLPHGHDVFGWSLGLDGLGGGEYESTPRGKVFDAPFYFVFHLLRG